MKKSLILLLMLITCLFANAQTSKYSNFDVVAQTPTTYQFTRYDEMPVSEYTGIPSIVIPLYEINVDEFRIPLNLTYHSGGIRVNQEASWVGLGWDMSVGAIIQTINGEDDIYPYHHISATTKFRPDYFPSYYYNVEFFPWKNDDYNYDSPRIDTLQRYPIEKRFGYRVATNFYVPENGKYVRKESLFNTSTLYIDSEPDVFIANFLGEKLHFILEFKEDPNKLRPSKAIVLNKKGYRIDISYSGDFQENSVWTITNPQGVKFFFEKRIETISFYSGGGRYPSYGSTDVNRTRNTWMLTKVETQNKKEIIFDYEITNSVIRDTTFSQIGEERISPIDYYDLRVGYEPTSFFWKPNQFPVKLTTNQSKTKEPYCYLKSITIPNGNIELKLSDRKDVSDSKKLDQIIINNTSGEDIKKIDLKYDYYQETNNNKYRLKLQEVTINGFQKYSFEYNNTALPPKNSYAQDYWGYYNGCLTNQSLLPNPSRLLYFDTKHIDNKNNMSANLPYTKAGILEKINYPTGGSLSFDYELNEFEKINDYWIPDYDNNTNILSKGYGLRIKELVYRNNNEEEVKKVIYEYKKGKAIVPQKPVRIVSYQCFDPNWSNATHTLRIYREWVAILSTAGSSQSGPFSSNTRVGYDTVISIQRGKGINSNGKIVSVYHNSYDITNNSQDPGGHAYFVTYLPSMKNPNYPENGSLKQKLYYDRDENLLKESRYDYKTVFSDIHYGVKISGYSPIIRTIVEVGGGDNVSFQSTLWPQRHLFSYYPIFDFETLLTKEKEINYLNDSIEINKEYSYDDYNRVSDVITNTSEGVNMREELLYPSGESASVLLPKNRNGEIVGVNKYLDNNQIYYLNKNYYYDNADKNVYVNRIDEGITKETSKSVYLKYTSYGRISERKGIDNKYQTYFWGHDFQYPIAEIKNASYEQVIAALSGVKPDGSLASSPDMSKINDLRQLLPQSQVTTYTYRPLVGMISVIDPRGQVTKYDYDWEGRLKTIYLAEDGRDKIIKRYEYQMPGYLGLRGEDYIEPKPEPIDPEPEPELAPDPYEKGKTGSVLINIGARGDGSYGLTGWNYDTKSVKSSNVITKTYKTIEASEYIWTTENLRLKYGTYASINMNWVNLTQADVDKFANEYLNGQKIPLEEFEEIFGTWVTLYDVAMMYRNIYWGVPIPETGKNDHTWSLPSKEDIWQLYGQAPRTSGNVYEDIKDFLFASACDNKYNWSQNMFNRRNISGLTLTPLGMRESNQGGAIYGFGQVASLQTSEWAKIETLADRDLSGNSGIISNPYSYHFTQARHRRPLTAEELGYKMYIDATNDAVLMLPHTQVSSLSELPKGLERGIALRYANREHMKVLKKWSEIQAEATEIKSKLKPTNNPAPPVLLPCAPEPEPEITPDPYEKGQQGEMTLWVASADPNYGLYAYDYDNNKEMGQYDGSWKTYPTIGIGEYEVTTKNLTLHYRDKFSVAMGWVNNSQTIINQMNQEYNASDNIDLGTFMDINGTYVTLYNEASSYRKAFKVYNKARTTQLTGWDLISSADFLQMMGQAPVKEGDDIFKNVMNFLGANQSDVPATYKADWFEYKNVSGFTMTPLGRRHSNLDGVMLNGKNQKWMGYKVESGIRLKDYPTGMILFSRLNGISISNNLYHFCQARYSRAKTDQELGYKMYIDAAKDAVVMLPYDQVSTLPELPKGVERGVALRYANRKYLKVVKKWSEIQKEATKIKNIITGL